MLMSKMCSRLCQTVQFLRTNFASHVGGLSNLLIVSWIEWLYRCAFSGCDGKVDRFQNFSIFNLDRRLDDVRFELLVDIFDNFVDFIPLDWILNDKLVEIFLIFQLDVDDSVIERDAEMKVVEVGEICPTIAANALWVGVVVEDCLKMEES